MPPADPRSVDADAADDDVDRADARALKHLFDRARLRLIAAQAAEASPGFDPQAFLALCCDGLDGLSVMQRMRRVATSLRATLPGGYRAQLQALRALAPRMGQGFACLSLSEFVALYGLDDFDASLEALGFFTGFGSSEFAVRPFLQHDARRTLAAMRAWADAPDEHLRRLASEGCRPRLPWASRLPALQADPGLAEPILQALRSDPSAYVRRSVANHLNDIAKDHPAWVMARLEAWPLESDPRSAWIARHALRTLVKRGDRRALAILGAGAVAEVEVLDFLVSPAALRLGDSLALRLVLRSTAGAPQKLVVDYAVHYVKAAGHAAAKVFKWKTLQLASGQSVELHKRQLLKDFSTRVHHAGWHGVEVLVNGDCLARGGFQLER